MLHVLHAKLAEICPILGVNSDRVITFDPAATGEQRALAQAFVDSWGPREAAEAQASEEAKGALKAIDLASVRALREYVAAQPGAPQRIKDLEQDAVTERGKIRP